MQGPCKPFIICQLRFEWSGTSDHNMRVQGLVPSGTLGASDPDMASYREEEVLGRCDNVVGEYVSVKDYTVDRELFFSLSLEVIEENLGCLFSPTFSFPFCTSVRERIASSCLHGWVYTLGVVIGRLIAQLPLVCACSDVGKFWMALVAGCISDHLVPSPAMYLYVLGRQNGLEYLVWVEKLFRRLPVVTVGTSARTSLEYPTRLTNSTRVSGCWRRENGTGSVVGLGRVLKGLLNSGFVDDVYVKKLLEVAFQLEPIDLRRDRFVHQYERVRPGELVQISFDSAKLQLIDERAC
ncbi:hypothetical protein Tco_1577162 [Tanacetum coccineum]